MTAKQHAKNAAFILIVLCIVAGLGIGLVKFVNAVIAALD